MAQMNETVIERFEHILDRSFWGSAVRGSRERLRLLQGFASERLRGVRQGHHHTLRVYF